MLHAGITPDIQYGSFSAKRLAGMEPDSLRYFNTRQPCTDKIGKANLSCNVFGHKTIVHRGESEKDIAAMHDKTLGFASVVFTPRCKTYVRHIGFDAYQSKQATMKSRCIKPNQ